MRQLRAWRRASEKITGGVNSGPSAIRVTSTVKGVQPLQVALRRLPADNPVRSASVTKKTTRTAPSGSRRRTGVPGSAISPVRRRMRSIRPAVTAVNRCCDSRQSASAPAASAAATR